MKPLLLFTLLLLFSLPSFSQDTLVMRDGSGIAVKVVEVSIDSIRYRRHDLPDGPLFLVPKTDVFMIKYQNGTRDVFAIEAGGQPAPSALAAIPPGTDMYHLGKMDGRQHVKASGAYWGSAASTFSCLPAGVIVAIGTAATAPKETKLNAPEPELLKDPEYRQGYKKGAWNKKAESSVLGFTTGIAASVALLFLLTMAYE